MRNRATMIVIAFGLLGVFGGTYMMPALADARLAIRAVLVRSVDEKGRSPYMEFRTESCPGGGAVRCEVIFPPVPAGRRLVLEYVNASINFATGGVRRTALLAPADVILVLPVRPISDANLVIVYESTLVYFESGQTPIFQIVVAAGTDVPLITAALSGYLVRLDQ